MYSQQKHASIKPIPFDKNYSTEMSIEELKKEVFPYRHPSWKLALVEPVLQSQLGVVSGDTILIRIDMLSKPVACTVANYYPVSDIGMKIIRLSKFAIDKLDMGKNNQVLVEKWDKINSKKLTLEYIIESWTIDQQIEHQELLSYLEGVLPNIVKDELKLLPIALHDYFETSINVKNREEPLNVDYWIKQLSPNFPITTVTKETKIEVKSRAKRIRGRK
jgi:hypothetical protein